MTFLGAVDDDDLIELYAGALAVVYPPFDEDFGYVTLEAFLARKPVDHRDRLRRAERVRRRRRQRRSSCAPEPEALAAAINRLAADRAARGGAWATPATTRARRITWDGVIEKLVA